MHILPSFCILTDKKTCEENEVSISMTIKELAKLADVSIATVSKIMNNKDENISPVTREKVLRIAQQHNYSPYAKASAKHFLKPSLSVW